jgi:hypothetical protein
MGHFTLVAIDRQVDLWPLNLDGIFLRPLALRP